MSTPTRVLMAQLNLLVGDIPGNTSRVIETALKARDEHHADLVLFPELALSGYPPEDLLLRPSLELRIAQALDRIMAEVSGITLVLGYPRYRDGALYNMAGVIRDGELIAEYAKQCLPNYQVFDEQRYFVAGDQPCVFEHEGVRIGLSICEDIWHSTPTAQLAEAGVDLLLSLNASPYHINKPAQRIDVVAQRAQQLGAPVVYLNQTGAQDELVFDGNSMFISAQGETLFQGAHCEEALYTATFAASTGTLTPEQPSLVVPSRDASVYQALVTGVRDYINKNGFKGVVLGLSGGIDSALTVAVAVDALGPERVEAVMMPFRYTSSMSIEDAEAEARALGITYDVISIEPLYDSFMQQLQGQFAGYAPDTTEENLQARCRGVLLMAISNKKGYLVLTTGNKSEMAVGYSTLYGDMAGGFDVLKDIPKTLVYQLSRYRNTVSPVIPQRVIDRPPSAELAPDQTDQDNLPDYDVLDRILELYVERDYSAQAIIDEGFEPADVNRVLRLVDINEYKRRQAPIGPRVTERGFGRDRRYPITSGWKAGI
ncbi:NAD+ synthase (glutamine-hydrolysing) [Marinobacterium halophilum]|uniref:Glutamine-dependent NAD(+) synthetase n=1 Tax=Marinobacterium halophilum TaxID=267374 RepID=A0A2P8EXU6_9GAMM|nr:NAD+ synthase [Marinobacterium halophilum]PSL14286.1 NAD+ synthase (glutamine-hydrolysing) [Marinobacterium halophilum]